MKQKILFFIFILGMTHAIAKEDLCPPSSLYYIKTGVGETSWLLPTSSFGIGGRHLFGHHGVDFSLNVQACYLILLFDGAVQAKAQYLYYPNPNATHAFYLGGGAGYGIRRCEICAMTCGVSSGNTSYFLTADATIGWEFWRERKIRPFVQLEVSQPIIYLKRKQEEKIPYITLFLGLGF